MRLSWRITGGFTGHAPITDLRILRTLYLAGIRANGVAAVVGFALFAAVWSSSQRLIVQCAGFVILTLGLGNAVKAVFAGSYCKAPGEGGSAHGTGPMAPSAPEAAA